LLIRLCTLWFGLALGVIALLIYRATQHTPIFAYQGEAQLPLADGVSSVFTPESLLTLQTAAATSNSGDTLK